MRVTICWAHVNGYMAACWRALANRPGVVLSIIAFRSGAPTTNAAFSDSVVAGLDCRLLDSDERHDATLVATLVRERRPDLLVLCGWFHPPYVRLVNLPDLRDKKFVMGMDTPLRYTWRQRLARLKLGRYLARMHRVIVPGERSWHYARYLGVEETRLRRGVYGIDYAGLTPVGRRRAPDGAWPRRFLFVGRYIAIKGVDVLLDAYGRYRASVGGDPWTLSCCGTGPMSELMNDRPGVEDLGFVQPADLAGVMERHGAFVIASRYDPWPLVVVEACAAGLPVICTEACGSAVEVVRGYHNGLTVTTGDAAALAAAMRWVHDHPDRLPDMGARGSELAAAFSAERWAERWAEMFTELLPA